MTTLATILVILLCSFLLFELSGMNFLIRESFMDDFSEERFRSILRRNKVSNEELAVFMNIYKLIADTDPSEYSVHSPKGKIESIDIKNVSFSCDYVSYERKYTLLWMTFYTNPKKDSDGIDVDLITSKTEIGDFVIDFIMARIHKFCDVRIKNERQKRTDEYYKSIKEVNKFF